jgi:hypothetical protein
MTNTLLHPVMRFVRVGTALVTVWCLGCGAFEPLVSSLSGTGNNGMSCSSDQTVGSARYERADEANESTPQQVQTVGALDRHESGSYSCGCESCYSSSPVTISLELHVLSAPEAIPTTPAFPESVNRTPLLPPPQLLS